MEAEKLDWLTAEYVQKVLRNYENDNSILVTSLRCEPATAKGDNYASIMIRAKVEYSSSKSGVGANEKRSLIVKSSPMAEGAQKDMMERSTIFDTEIKMMETTLENMNDILNENDYRFNARIFHTETGNPSILVMEDLVPLGYTVVNRQVGHDFDHSILALEGLAKFHASSVALYEKDPSSVTTYKMGIYNHDQPQQLKNLFINAIKRIAIAMETWDEIGPIRHSYIEKLSNMADSCYDRTVKVAGPKDGEFSCLNHGDFWITNMLFRYDENGKVNGHIFADFQMAVYSSPAIDLFYFLNTSISEDVELNHRDVLLEKYLETLTCTMRKLGCETKAPTMDELKASMKERELYGLMTSCTILPLVLADKKDKASFNEFIEMDGDSPIYRGLAFRKAMVRRLPYYYSQGLFDV